MSAKESFQSIEESIVFVDLQCIVWVSGSIGVVQVAHS